MHFTACVNSFTVVPLLSIEGLVFSRSFALRVLTDSCSCGRGMAVMLCLSSGEAKSGFLVDFFSRKHAILLVEQATWMFLLPVTFYWFPSTTFGDVAVVLGFVVCNIFVGRRPDHNLNCLLVTIFHN